MNPNSLHNLIINNSQSKDHTEAFNCSLKDHEGCRTPKQPIANESEQFTDTPSQWGGGQQPDLPCASMYGKYVSECLSDAP